MTRVPRPPVDKLWIGKCAETGVLLDSLGPLGLPCQVRDDWLTFVYLVVTASAPPVHILTHDRELSWVVGGAATALECGGRAAHW